MLGMAEISRFLLGKMKILRSVLSFWDCMNPTYCDLWEGLDHFWCWWILSRRLVETDFLFCLLFWQIQDGAEWAADSFVLFFFTFGFTFTLTHEEGETILPTSFLRTFKLYLPTASVITKHAIHLGKGGGGGGQEQAWQTEKMSQLSLWLSPPVEVVGQRRSLPNLSSIMDIGTHPLHQTVGALCTFSRKSCKRSLQKIPTGLKVLPDYYHVHNNRT